MDKAEDACCHVAGRFESEVLLPLPLLVHGVKDGLPLGVVTSPQVVYLLLHLGVQTRHPGKQQMGVSWGEEHIIMTRVLELSTGICEISQWRLAESV